MTAPGRWNPSLCPHKALLCRRGPIETEPTDDSPAIANPKSIQKQTRLYQETIALYTSMTFRLIQPARQGTKTRHGGDGSSGQFVHPTWILNRIYRSAYSDIHCGMRGLTKDALLRIGLTSAGWEYASEMVLKASRIGLKINEVPVNFYTDREDDR